MRPKHIGTEGFFMLESVGKVNRGSKTIGQFRMESVTVVLEGLNQSRA